MPGAGGTLFHPWVTYERIVMKTLELTDDEAKVLVDRIIFGPDYFTGAPEEEALIDRILAALGYQPG